MTARPSETDEGLKWIENFRPEEQRTARLLLDSLQIVSETTFRASLGQFLVDRAASLPKPVVFFPIRKLPKSGGNEGTDDQDPRLAGFGDPSSIEPLPLSVKYAAHPGSEGPVGNVLRDVLRDHQETLGLVEASTLAQLRSQKPRSIVLVDDYCGSGSRAHGYVEAWTRHRTIRSWHSRGLIRFHVAALAVSGQAQKLLNKSKWIARVHALQPAADFTTAPWSPDERRDIEALCRYYAQTKKLALGFGEARGLLAFQHTVPNTIPMVLWQRRDPHKVPFAPMFLGRRMTSVQQMTLADYSLPVRASDIARSLRQLRLADALDQQPAFTARFVILTLAAAARGIRDHFRLAMVLSLPVSAAEAIVQACQALALLDSSGRLTETGRQELRQARQRARTPANPHFSLHGREEPYYPYQLRDAGDI